MDKAKFGFYPTHPGDVLKDEIEYRGISQASLARHINMSTTVLNEILNAKRSVTPATACLFEAALGISAEVLLRLQLNYDMQMVQRDKKLLSRLAGIRRIAAVL